MFKVITADFMRKPHACIHTLALQFLNFPPFMPACLLASARTHTHTHKNVQINIYLKLI